MSAELILRAAAGPGIGLGHFQRMRMLARVADARGISTRMIPGAPEAAVPAGWWQALAAPATVVLDTLWSGNAAATATEVASLLAAGHRVVVIDSMPPDHFVALPGAAPHFLVTPYLGADRLRPPADAGVWLHGARYALLDPAFAESRGLARQFPALPRLLVACGGADPGGLSLAISRRLPRDAGAAAADIVVGPLFGAELVSGLEAAAAANPRLRLCDAPETLAGLVADASIVVGRLGLIRYEAAALGRTGIFLHDSTLYRSYLEMFSAGGLAEIHFAVDAGGAGRFLDRVAALAAPGVEHAFNAAGFAAVDGLGCARLLDRIAAQA